jgi:hypothetical protein
MRQEALNLARDIMMNCYRPENFPSWILSGNTVSQIQAIINGQGKPLIGTGSYLMIMPFGDQKTYQKFKINRVDNYPEDVHRFYQFPFLYNEQQTFSEIAKAKAADIAAEVKIDSYYLIVIIGLGEDTNSLSYTTLERSYLDDYRSSVTVNSLAIFRYSADNADFKIEFSKIDISRMLNKPESAQLPKEKIIQQKNVDQKILEIISPPGSEESPFTTESSNVVVSWRCIGCDKNTDFQVMVSNLEQGNTISHPATHKQFQNLSLPAGKYKIVVSGDQMRSKPRYVEVISPDSSRNMLWFLLLIGVLVAFILFWKNRKKEPAGFGLDKQAGSQHQSMEPGPDDENPPDTFDRRDKGNYQSF